MSRFRFMGFLVSLVLTTTLLLPAVCNAAAPAWSPGFPKLAEKKALMQWAPVKGASAYKIYRGEQKGKGAKLIATVNTNNYIDKDLSAGKTFYYSLAAVVGGKESERSVEGSVSIQAEKVYVSLKTPKLMEAHIKDLPDGKVAVGIRWEGAVGTDLVGVNVYRTTAKGKDYVMVGSSQSDGYTDADVQQGVTYYYAVSAVDSQFKETKRSNEITAKVPAAEAPAAPAAPAAAKSAEDRAALTKMRAAKLLFSMPRDPENVGKRGGDPFAPLNALDVAVDEAVGHIYVTASQAGGVLVYDMDGKYQFIIRKDGINGTKNFGAAEGVIVGADGNVYVTDWDGPDICVFDFAGKPVTTHTVDIKNIAQYKDATARNYGIAQGADGTFYVSDPVANSVHAYDSGWKRRFDISGAVNDDERKKYKGRQMFNGPSYVTVTNQGDLVFVDSGYSKLMVFGSDGKFKRNIGRMGSAAGEIYYPVGITTGNAGEIFLASAAQPNVEAFSPDGKFLYALCNEKCDGPIETKSMRGIHVDKKDRMYIADGIMNRVMVYQLTEGLKDIKPPK